VADEDLLTGFHTAADDGGGAEPDFDTTVAHPARVWDYLLGGKDNFAADRTAGEQVLRIMPEMGLVARSGREFLARAVRFLAGEAGVRQFLELVSPGVTPLGHWRPGPVNVGALPWLPTYTAVGRKP